MSNQQRANEHRNSPRGQIPPGFSWECMGNIGEGGVGRAYLWHLLDTTQKVVDRMILKYNSPLPGIAPRGDMLGPGPGEGEYKEPYFHQILAPDGTRAEDVYTVPVLATEHSGTDYSTWRIYMPFFSFGDLNQFLEGKGFLPEPFIWYTFFRLANAAINMENPPGINPNHQNHSIVHHDLKPGNILVQGPGISGLNSPFPAYPSVYIADFGNSQFAYTDQPRENQTTGWCTVSWVAPEIWNHPPDGWKMQDWQAQPRSYTNVWQVGYVILNMMRQEYPDPIDWASARKIPLEPKYAKDPNNSKTWYSDDLLTLVHECLRYEPATRPNPRKLVEKIKSAMPKHIAGMDRWGTSDWFEEQEDLANQNADDKGNDNPKPPKGGPRKPVSTSNFHVSRSGEPLTSIGKRKHASDTDLIGSKKQRLTRVQKEDRRRRQRLVAKQIVEGKPQPWDDDNSPLQAEQRDRLFQCNLEYMMYWRRPDRDIELSRFFQRENPRPVKYRPDIDDFRKWARDYAAYGPHGLMEDQEPPEGWNFRKTGARPPSGGGLLPSEDPPSDSSDSSDDDPPSDLLGSVFGGINVSSNAQAGAQPPNPFVGHTQSAEQHYMSGYSIAGSNQGAAGTTFTNPFAGTNFTNPFAGTNFTNPFAAPSASAQNSLTSGDDAGAGGQGPGCTQQVQGATQSNVQSNPFASAAAGSAFNATAAPFVPFAGAQGGNPLTANSATTVSGSSAVNEMPPLMQFPGAQGGNVGNQEEEVDDDDDDDDDDSPPWLTQPAQGGHNYAASGFATEQVTEQETETETETEQTIPNNPGTMAPAPMNTGAPTGLTPNVGNLLLTGQPTSSQMVNQAPQGHHHAPMEYDPQGEDDNDDGNSPGHGHHCGCNSCFWIKGVVNNFWI